MNFGTPSFYYGLSQLSARSVGYGVELDVIRKSGSWFSYAVVGSNFLFINYFGSPI